MKNRHDKISEVSQIKMLIIKTRKRLFIPFSRVIKLPMSSLLKYSCLTLIRSKGCFEQYSEVLNHVDQAN